MVLPLRLLGLASQCMFIITWHGQAGSPVPVPPGGRFHPYPSARGSPNAMLATATSVASPEQLVTRVSANAPAPSDDHGSIDMQQSMCSTLCETLPSGTVQPAPPPATGSPRSPPTPGATRAGASGSLSRGTAVTGTDAAPAAAAALAQAGALVPAGPSVDMVPREHLQRVQASLTHGPFRLAYSAGHAHDCLHT